ncbi:MAG: GNAT family N-acetyltransferase [SAR324 cluster bacterium]|nr:GNAT family N-acetyltransferase [SAR324 cluster bacterium]
MRIPKISEARNIADFHLANREHLSIWEPLRGSEFYTIPFWQEQIRSAQQQFLHQYSLKLCLFQKENQNLVGMINFVNFERGVFHSCRLGYKIGQNFEGKGMMHESLHVAIAFVFARLNFHRIEANYIPRNHRSGTLLKRLGFKINGQEDHYLRINGKWETHVLTSLINPDWKAPEGT